LANFFFFFFKFFSLLICPFSDRQRDTSCPLCGGGGGGKTRRPRLCDVCAPRLSPVIGLAGAVGRHARPAGVFGEKAAAAAAAFARGGAAAGPVSRVPPSGHARHAFVAEPR